MGGEDLRGIGEGKHDKTILYDEITKKKESLPSAVFEIETIIQKIEGCTGGRRAHIGPSKNSLLLAKKGMSLFSSPKPSDHLW